MFHFNPRSPYGERLSALLLGFLLRYFNPRSPYGERLFLVGMCMIPFAISIHAPLTGSDLCLLTQLAHSLLFQSTLPLRGATTKGSGDQKDQQISIHAPLTGSDRWASSSWAAVSISIHAPLTGSDCLSDRFGRPPNNFNPRSPYGERPQTWAGTPQLCNFNPRSPYGERPGLNASRYQKCDFNPRSPYGERLRPKT